MEESAPGQFNFINSQLRMNENHVENQNEYEKMSLMVENLVSCKIENIFKDIDHAKEDLKTRIKCAIDADKNQNANTPNNASLKMDNDALKSQIVELTKIVKTNNQNNPDLNKVNQTTQPSTQQINSFIKPSNVTNAPSGDLQTQLTQALARIKELDDALKASTTTDRDVTNNGANNSTNNGANNSTNTINDPTNNNANNNPQSNNSKNKFADFVIGHYTPNNIRNI